MYQCEEAEKRVRDSVVKRFGSSIPEQPPSTVLDPVVSQQRAGRVILHVEFHVLIINPMATMLQIRSTWSLQDYTLAPQLLSSKRRTVLRTVLGW